MSRVTGSAASPTGQDRLLARASSSPGKKAEERQAVANAHNKAAAMDISEAATN